MLKLRWLILVTQEMGKTIHHKMNFTIAQNIILYDTMLEDNLQRVHNYLIINSVKNYLLSMIS